MHKAVPKALLFDLGGVLIDIDFGRALRAWQSKSRLSLEEVKRTFRFDLPYEQHERGGISSTAYFRHLMTTLELDDDLAHVAKGWNAIFVGQIEETVAAVRTMRNVLPCYVFTNTNATHMETWSRLYPDLVASFEHVFASHLIGLRKPEKQAFAYISRHIGVSADSIAFFDDSPENVNGAIHAGLLATLVRSPQDVKRALQEYGFAI